MSNKKSMKLHLTNGQFDTEWTDWCSPRTCDCVHVCSGHGMRIVFTLLGYLASAIAGVSVSFVCSSSCMTFSRNSYTVKTAAFTMKARVSVAVMPLKKTPRPSSFQLVLAQSIQPTKLRLKVTKWTAKRGGQGTSGANNGGQCCQAEKRQHRAAAQLLVCQVGSMHAGRHLAMRTNREYKPTAGDIC